MIATGNGIGTFVYFYSLFKDNLIFFHLISIYKFARPFFSDYFTFFYFYNWWFFYIVINHFFNESKFKSSFPLVVIQFNLSFFLNDLAIRSYPPLKEKATFFYDGDGLASKIWPFRTIARLGDLETAWITAFTQGELVRFEFFHDFCFVGIHYNMVPFFEAEQCASFTSTFNICTVVLR